jgi:methyl-accepting chemotaxis protein
MINEITQDISPITALPDLLSENRPAAVNLLVEVELPRNSIEMKNLVRQLNTFKTEVNATGDEVEGLLNQTKTYVDSVVSDANEALTNASEVKANMEQIDRLAYSLTQMPITMSAVIDGELIMYYNDPIQSLSLVDGDLIVNY